MELRQKNLETLLAFFGPETRTPGGARVRAKLFAPKGVKEQVYPIGTAHTDPSAVYPAHELLEHQPDVNCGLDLDCVIWATEDPGCFHAETVETGNLELCGKTGPFRHYCLHTFHLEDGMITRWQVFPNTFTVYTPLGIEMTNARGPVPDGPVMELPPEMARGMAENGRRIREELLPTLVLESVSKESAGGGSVRIYAYGTFDPQDEALREKNRKSVSLYFDKAGREALGISRNDLFAENGLTEVPVDHMDPLNTDHHAFTTRPGPNTNPADPYWRTEVLRFDATARPDCFWVETCSYHTPDAPEKPLDGMPTYTSRGYWNHYNFFFQVEDGKILYCREFLDPRSERRVMGIQEAPLPDGALDIYRYL